MLLVTPLAAPAICFDLRRGCSLVEHLVDQGRPTYLVEYGAVSFRDRNLGMEHWIEEVVPTAIREASAHAGGRPVHVVGWSLGGVFAMLAAADASTADRVDHRLRLAVRRPRGAAGRAAAPAAQLPDGRGAITRLYQTAGGAPQPLVRWAFQLSSFQKLVTKPIAIARNLDDADYLAQIEAVDRFTANMIAYPGRTFGQLYHRLLKGNALVDGTFDLEGRTLSVADITVPVLVFAGATDGIAPVAAVKASVPLLSGSREVRFEIVPGGHLGMLTGRKARTTTWPLLDAWIDGWTESQEPAPRPRRTTTAPTAPRKTTAIKAAKQAPAKKAAAKKRSPAKKTTAKKAGVRKRVAEAVPPVDETAADPAAIGVNPQRRYGSADSRALRR